ncbi:MAG TPA: inorganic pyrophosphatase, partial [Chloroflexota bacterium]|nr:inorganic pyrophosphatase [Chloroflexota bacterium]
MPDAPLTAPTDDPFWLRADDLVASAEIVIDWPTGRERGGRAYPLDYGYLEGTSGGDGEGVDVWRGSLPELRVTGAVFTVDVLDRDAEVKLLVGCTPEEAAV